MTVSEIIPSIGKEYQGLSGDAKPTGVPINSIFHERDTRINYFTFDGTNWIVLSKEFSALDAVVLGAGSAIAGKVGIDQTTPGTTNRVDVGAALPAGSNIIGKVAIDQTTPGVTNAISAPLQTGNHYMVTMTLANTEYSQALPANTKKFSIKTQDATAFRLAYITAKVATPAVPYFDILDGGSKSEDNINVTALTLYFASSYAGKIIEIEAWA
jgi:hypothetical protein